VLEAGEYRFFAGTSVRDGQWLEETWTLPENRIVRQLASRMAPTCLEKRLRADGTWENCWI
jgi:beta-glucosidase